MSRKRARGAHKAERGPATTSTSPRRAFSHRAKRSPAGSEECSTATREPKRAASSPATLGVSPISGTRISACPPARTAASAVRR
jgi:hypothetical protein